MAVAPHSFYRALGPFGVANDHYLRDVASFEAAIGVGLLIAIRRPTRRVPMLAVSALQFGLHSNNQLVDNAAHPGWIGYLDFFALFATALQLGWLLLVAERAHPDQPDSGGGPT